MKGKEKREIPLWAKEEIFEPCWKFLRRVSYTGSVNSLADVVCLSIFGRLPFPGLTFNWCNARTFSFSFFVFIFQLAGKGEERKRSNLTSEYSPLSFSFLRLPSLRLLLALSCTFLVLPSLSHPSFLSDHVATFRTWGNLEIRDSDPSFCLWLFFVLRVF